MRTYVHVHCTYSTIIPYLYARETVIIYVILFQDTSPIVIEIYPHLFSTVNSVVSQSWLATYKQSMNRTHSYNRDTPSSHVTVCDHNILCECNHTCIYTLCNSQKLAM